jgi:hypothetical protein
VLHSCYKLTTRLSSHLHSPAVSAFRLYDDWNQGIARTRSSAFSSDRFRPFSCKRYLLSSSCEQKRTLLFDEYLDEQLLLALPHRQFVFTLPKALRVFLRHGQRLFADLARPTPRLGFGFFRKPLGDLRHLLILLPVPGRMAHHQEHPRAQRGVHRPALLRYALRDASTSGQRQMLLEPLREGSRAPEICRIRTSPVETAEEFQEFIVIEAGAPELTDNLVAFRTEFFSKRRVVTVGIVRKCLRAREARGDAAGREEKDLRMWSPRQFVYECEESGMVLSVENT